MDRGPQTDREWEQYSSHNIKLLQQLPISELYSLGESLKGIVVEYRAAIDNGEIPKEERSFTDLMLDVSKKRLDIGVI